MTDITFDDKVDSDGAAPLSATEQLTAADVNEIKTAVNSKADAEQPYIIGGSCISAPASLQVLIVHPAASDFTLPAGLATSSMVALTAATAETVITLTKNGASIGTATFAAAGTEATFAAAADAVYSAASTDYFTMVAPLTPDATLAGIGWSVRGVR